MFFSSFAVLVWTVWHRRHSRFGSVLPQCYLKMELTFPLLEAFCRLSSLPPVGLTSRSWMCWMKTAGDWPSVTLAGCNAYFFGSLLVDCGVFLLCLHLRLFPRWSGFKQLALLSFNLKLLSKIHISQDSVSFSSVRESIQLITIYRKYNDFFQRLCWPVLSTWLHWNMGRPPVGLSVGCWTEAYWFSVVSLLIEAFMILIWLD